MKPYVSELLWHDGRTHPLPIPAKYRELFDCAHKLRLKDGGDEDDMLVVGYRSLYVPEPDLSDTRFFVECIATELSALNEEQVKAIGSLCSAFGLPYRAISGIIDYIEIKQKEKHDNED